MTALSLERLTPFAGSSPARGTYPIKADVRIFKGALVGLDSAGRAMPATTIALGCLRIVGKASATYDNRTGSTLGGAAAAVDVEVEFGVFQFANSSSTDAIAAADVGKVVYAVDDQTVALTSNTDLRPVAGIVTEVVNSKPYVYMGPHVSPESAVGFVAIPLNSFVDADGDPLAKFSSAASPTFGLNLADSEALNIRWNNDATPGTALCQVSLPSDLDDASPMALEFVCSKSGATVGDATTLTVTAFILSVGDLHDADANCGGVTNALTGNATAKTTAMLTHIITAANVPALARSMTFTVTPTAGLLGTDDLMLHEARLRYVRKAS